MISQSSPTAQGTQEATRRPIWPSGSNYCSRSKRNLNIAANPREDLARVRLPAYSHPRNAFAALARSGDALFWQRELDVADLMSMHEPDNTSPVSCFRW